MGKINHAFFAKEAAFITVLCLMIAGICKAIGLSNSVLLVIFTMAVMTAAAIYPIQGKTIARIFGSSLLIVILIIAGGLLGKYCLLFGEALSLFFVGVAFYFPKTREDSGLLVTAVMMMVIFLFFPASLYDSLVYGLGGFGVAVIFTESYFFLSKIFSNQESKKAEGEISHRMTRCIVSTSSIFLGFISIYFLEKYSHLDHISWVALTIMMVIQGPPGQTMVICLKRTGINALGAVIGVVLFSYVLPPNFWVNFLLLTALLFSIFCFGYSYFWRVLFIELFVLALAYVMGSFESFTAIDRIILTAIGAGIVMLVTSMMYLLIYWIRKWPYSIR